MDIQFNGRTGEQISSDINQKFGEIEQIVNDAGTGVLAQVEVAQGFAIDAEAARDAAFVNANAYVSTAIGLMNTSVGEQFQVSSEDGFSIQRYRHDSGPVATPVGAPFATANRLASAFPERTGWAWAAVDSINNILFGVREDGVFEAQGVEIVEQITEALSRISGLENSIFVSSDPRRTGILFAIIDSDNQMLVRLSTDMVLYVGNIPAGTNQSLIDQIGALKFDADLRFATSFAGVIL